MSQSRAQATLETTYKTFYDAAQLGYDAYQQIKSIFSDKPEIPDELADALKDALGSNSSNPISVDWSRLTSVPISVNNFDLGVKGNVYLNELNGKIFGVPSGNFSTNQTNLYATTTTSNLVLDVGQSAAYLNSLQIYGASNTGLSFNSNVISAPTVAINGLTIGQSNASVQTLTACNFTASQATVPALTACNIQNFATVSNGSNFAYPLALNSTCNISFQTQSNAFLRVSSSNLQVSE